MLRVVWLVRHLLSDVAASASAVAAVEAVPGFDGVAAAVSLRQQPLLLLLAGSQQPREDAQESDRLRGLPQRSRATGEWRGSQ